TSVIYPLSLYDALPIWLRAQLRARAAARPRRPGVPLRPGRRLAPGEDRAHGRALPRRTGTGPAAHRRAPGRRRWRLAGRGPAAGAGGVPGGTGDGALRPRLRPADA